MDLCRVGLLACAAMVATSGCARFGVIDDGTSVSWGQSNGGMVLNAARLPDRGEAYRVPAKWSNRGLRYGTDELVGMVVHASRRVAAEFPGARLTIGDLAQRYGGPQAHHRSHQSGRDVDLVFYLRDRKGNVVEPDDMFAVGETEEMVAAGKGVEGAEGLAGVVSGYRFDVPRNWALVRALLENPVADVQFIFVYDALKQQLLDHAVASGEPDQLVAHAAAVMQQPGDSAKHDDHFHVRIYCSADDLANGCADRGDLRWTKKGSKHRPERMVASLSPLLREALPRPLPAMFVLGRLPFSP